MTIQPPTYTALDLYRDTSCCIKRWHLTQPPLSLNLGPFHIKAARHIQSNAQVAGNSHKYQSGPLNPTWH